MEVARVIIVHRWDSFNLAYNNYTTIPSEESREVLRLIAVYAEKLYARIRDGENS